MSVNKSLGHTKAVARIRVKTYLSEIIVNFVFDCIIYRADNGMHGCAVRSKTCCDVTERGAKLKFIEEWKKDGWARTDNWVDSTGYNCYQTQLPPTSLV